MAITLGNGNITYGDGSVQSTRPTLLGGIQGTAYTAVNLGRNSTARLFSTTEIYNVTGGGYFSQIPNTVAGIDAQTQVSCGYGAYRSGQTNSSDARGLDGGTIQLRMIYRTVGLA